MESMALALTRACSGALSAQARASMESTEQLTSGLQEALVLCLAFAFGWLVFWPLATLLQPFLARLGLHADQVTVASGGASRKESEELVSAQPHQKAACGRDSNHCRLETNVEGSEDIDVCDGFGEDGLLWDNNRIEEDCFSNEIDCSKSRMVSRIVALAADGDLAGCRQLLKRSTEEVVLDSSSRSSLVRAWRCVASRKAEVDLLLDIAEQLQDKVLAEASLNLGVQLRCGTVWLQHARGRLVAAGLAPTSVAHLVGLARAFGEERRPDLAADLWLSTAEAHGGIQETFVAPELFAAAFEVCTFCGDMDSALQLMQGSGWQLRSRNTSVLRSTQKLARWLASRQDIRGIQRCLEAIRSAGARPDLPTLRALLVACARAGDMTEAARVFELILDEGFAPDFATFAALLRGHAAATEVDEALAVLEKMRSHGFTPDVSIFESLFSACAARSSTRLADKVFEEMTRSGCRPSSATLATMIRLYSSRGEIRRAMRVFEDFPQQYGIQPDTQVYSTLLSACLTACMPELAREVLERMTSSGCTPNGLTYESLILSCVRLGEVDRAVGILNDALGNGRDEQPRPTFMKLKTIQELLTIIGKRRHAARLGLPLIARLTEAGYDLPQELVEAMTRSASSEGGRATFAQGRKGLQSCRDFWS